MRWIAFIMLAAMVGCGPTQGGSQRTSVASVSQATTPPISPSTKTYERREIPDLRTRTSGSDWPGFLGPTNDSVSSEKGIIAPWPKEGLRVVWHMPLGESYPMPSISRGRLFLFDRHGDKARLACHNSETGEFLWKFEYTTDYEDMYGYNGGPRCCPVVDDDRVYIYGPEGMLHCVNVLDGKPIWKVNTKDEFNVVQNFFGVASTPVVEGDLLIVQVGGSPVGDNPYRSRNPKGNGTGVVAFDKKTGQVRYKISDELASYAGPVLRTINGRRWAFMLARGGLLAFEPATGKIDFHFPWRSRLLESVNASNPVVVGDKVFISETYSIGSALLQVKPGGPDVIWSDLDKPRNKSMECHWMTPIHVDGYLYGSSGRQADDAELRCIELATGKVMWRETEFPRSSLLHVDGHFICLCEDGLLVLFKPNPHRFEEVSRMDLRRRRGLSVEPPPPNAPPRLRYPCWAAPILSHGLLYVRGEDHLICFELIPPKK